MVYNWLSKKSTRLTVACGKKIDLIVEDNQTKQGETTTIVCKFISQDHVSAIIGEVASSKSVEAAPICQASKIPQIASGLFYRRLSSGGHRPVCPRKITAQECRVYDGCEAGLQRRIGGKALEGAFFSNHFSVEDFRLSSKNTNRNTMPSRTFWLVLVTTPRSAWPMRSPEPVRQTQKNFGLRFRLPRIFLEFRARSPERQEVRGHHHDQRRRVQVRRNH